MSFAPVLPAGGLIGFRFLERSYESQLARFSRAPDIDRAVRDFIDRAGEVRSAADLVADRRLLRVALGAFGLDDEIGKGALIRRVLEEGTLDPSSFANRLADPAWKELSAALGFGDIGGRLGDEAVRRNLAERFRERQFERAVGEADVDLRLALNFRREIGRIAVRPGVDRSGWFQIMGSAPLRAVIEGALGLPESFGKLEIDAQRSILEDRARRIFGSESPNIFADREIRDRAVQRFLLNAQATASGRAIGGGSTALQLLTAGGLGNVGRASLFQSRL